MCAAAHGTVLHMTSNITMAAVTAALVTQMHTPYTHVSLAAFANFGQNLRGGRCCFAAVLQLASLAPQTLLTIIQSLFIERTDSELHVVLLQHAACLESSQRMSFPIMSP